MILNSLLYFLAWAATLKLASLGMMKTALIPALAGTAVHLFLLFYRKQPTRWVEIFLILYALLGGIILETLAIGSLAIRYSDSSLPPLWILSLYPLFATTLNHSLKMISRFPLAPGLFALAAPLSYIAGEKLGACVFPQGVAYAYFALFILWAALLFALAALNKQLLQIRQKTHDLFLQNGQATMLYDGECPLCSREVKILKQRDQNKKIVFVDISTPHYRKEVHPPLPYEEAMKQLYVVDEQGKLTKGTAAFFIVYAKIGWEGLALLFEAPLFKTLSHKGYQLFAKYRLLITGRSCKD